MVIAIDPKVLDGVTIGGLEDKGFSCENLTRQCHLVCARFFFSTYYASRGGLACLPSALGSDPRHLLRHLESLQLTTSCGISSLTTVAEHHWVLLGVVSVTLHLSSVNVGLPRILARLVSLRRIIGIPCPLVVSWSGVDGLVVMPSSARRLDPMVRSVSGRVLC
jgi:hypothetical protein